MFTSPRRRSPKACADYFNKQACVHIYRRLQKRLSVISHNREIEGSRDINDAKK